MTSAFTRLRLLRRKKSADVPTKPVGRRLASTDTTSAMTREELERAYWAVQDRSAALELVVGHMVLRLAATRPQPFEWIRSLLGAIRENSVAAGLDQMSDDEAERLNAELRIHVEALAARAAQRQT